MSKREAMGIKTELQTLGVDAELLHFGANGKQYAVRTANCTYYRVSDFQAFKARIQEYKGGQV